MNYSILLFITNSTIFNDNINIVGRVIKKTTEKLKKKNLKKIEKLNFIF